MVTMMPEVTCPKCGLTINLENRRETDYELIVNAARNSATFTELLHATRLSRKTLSLRLKELCSKGTLVKDNGLYTLRESLREPRREPENHGQKISFSRAFHDRRVRTLVWMFLLASSFSVSGYAFAMYTMAPAQQQVNNAPAVIGYSTMTLDVSNVQDLYAWQVAITFNATQMKVTQVSPGDFVGLTFPLFANSTDTAAGLLLVAGSLEGNVPGRSGNGTLATIVFGYFVSGYDTPVIVPKQMGFRTFMEDSQLANIPVGTKLSLEVIS
jgi:hypothetical protein